RDLKPANIMITAEDETMIMDFGVARSTGNPTAQTVPGAHTIARNLSAAMAHADRTVVGAVVGTVGYMAPEQAKGQEVDQRADVYALGLILYDLMAGQGRSSAALNPLAELQSRTEHPPPPVKSLVPEVSDELDQIVTHCLEPDPGKRFQTSEELSIALAALDDAGKPIPIPPRVSPRLVAGAAAIVLTLIVAT